MSREAMEQIKQCTDLAYEAISLAEGIAERVGIEFSFGGRLAYGMGGDYVPLVKAGNWDTRQGWNASSQSC